MQNASSDLDVDRLGDEIAELSAHLDAATARLLDLIREFDCARRLEQRLSLVCRLAELARRARHGCGPGARPGCARSWHAATACPGPRPRRALVRQGAGAHPCGHAGDRGAPAGRGACRHRRPRRAHRPRLAPDGQQGRGSRDHPATPSRALHVYQDEDGMVTVRGRLAPEVGALLVQALAAAREALYQQARSQEQVADAGDVSAETPTMAQQQADALALLAETALHHGIDPGALRRERYQVVVHVDAPVLADPDGAGQSVLEDGTHVSAETSRRLACDASRVVMQHGAGRSCGGGRGPDPDDSAGDPASAASSRPRLPLSGLRRARWAGASHSSLGARRPDHALQSHPALSPAPSRRPRRGLSGRSTARRRAAIPAS